jgi:hypothetical protein
MRMTSPARMLALAAVLWWLLPSAVAAAPGAAARPGGVVGFCKAHGTVDYPPAKGLGARHGRGVPPELAAVGADKWRCLDGQVLVCRDSADGDQCARKADDPRPPIVAEACREAGDSDHVPFYAGHPYRYDWACRGGRPVITKAYALDRRGFFRKAWARLVVRKGVVVAPRQAPDILR